VLPPTVTRTRTEPKPRRGPSVRSRISSEAPAGRLTKRSSHEIVESLRRGAGSRVTIPRSGYDPVLTDIVLHDLDIRVPLGIPRSTPEDRLWVAFDHLTAKPSPGFAMGARLAGLHLATTDTGWSRGSGPPVRGRAEDLLLAIGDRGIAFDKLDGDGVSLLRQRVATQPKPGPLRRLAVPLRVLTNPPHRDRRSRHALATAAPEQ
jgi:hypothetical protein